MTQHKFRFAMIVAATMVAATPALASSLLMQMASELVFNKTDKDGDGFISKTEWVDGTKPDFKACDTNKDNKISKAEWLAKRPQAPLPK